MAARIPDIVLQWLGTNLVFQLAQQVVDRI